MNIGTRIAERYFVQEQIGNETFIVVNISSGTRWVLKHLPFLKNQETLDMLHVIRHPSLPRIFETFVIDEKDYFLLEYIEGVTLYDLCEKNGGKISFVDACDYMAVITRTLYFLHSQSPAILHLDIKPGNIVISKNNLPCLIDYGTAQNIKPDYSDTNLLQNGFYGTMGYSPPELLKGEPPTEQSDIYMVGMTLLRLISGVEPTPSFHNDTKTMASIMPATVAKIIGRCIMNNKNDRYGNASELAYDLEIACSTTLSYETYPNRECTPVACLNESSAEKNYNPEESIEKSVNHEYHGKKKSSNHRIFCIWDNCQFAAEIAYVIASKKKKVLLIDADLLSPGIDLLVEFKDSYSQSNRNVIGNSNLADLMEEYSKKRLSSDSIKMFARKTSVETLSCLSGNYRMEDYEYYSTEGLVEIIKTASLSYDFIVISCGKFIYDEFTCVTQICSDIVFIPIIANTVKFREFNRFINFLTGRKQLEREKIVFVGYDYMASEDLSHGTCDELCQGAFAGVISYSQKRRMMQGTKKPYINAMENRIEKQYMGLLKKLSISV